MIVFNLDPPYFDIGTSTRAGGLWQSVSSATQRYVIIGLTPTMRRESNRSSGQQSGVRMPVVVAASPPSSSSPHLRVSAALLNCRFFSCLLFTSVLISCCSVRCMRHSYSMTMSWLLRSHDVQCIIFVTAGNLLSPRDFHSLWLVPDWHEVATLM